MSKLDIQRHLDEAFKPDFCEVIDESYKHIGHAGSREGGHYRLRLVSKVFTGKTLLERHRLVYQALLPIKHTIHALSIQAKAPEEV